MKNKVGILLACACITLTSCTQISISPFRAHTIANTILRNQENVKLPNAYTFTYTHNSFLLENNNNSSTDDYSLVISYSKSQMYLRIDQKSLTAQTVNGSYTTSNVDLTNWVYVVDTDLYIVQEDKMLNNTSVDINKYVFADEAAFAFESYYSLNVPHFLNDMLGSEALHSIIQYMETVSFENEYNSNEGITLSQKYSSSSEGNLTANLYLNAIDHSSENSSYSFSHSISAIYKQNLLVDYIGKRDLVTYENNLLVSREYFTASSTLKDKYVQIITPRI